MHSQVTLTVPDKASLPELYTTLNDRLDDLFEKDAAPAFRGHAYISTVYDTVSYRLHEAKGKVKEEAYGDLREIEAYQFVLQSAKRWLEALPLGAPDFKLYGIGNKVSTTQKLAAIRQLSPTYFSTLPVFSFPMGLPPFLFFTPSKETAPLWSKGIFARPAPRTPRHGFVDSRQIKSWVDFANIITETLMQDKFGEVILMPKVSGQYSYVANNAGVTIGRGHDGVTAGTDKNAIFIPAQSNIYHWNVKVAQMLHPNATSNSIGIKENAFIEAVTGDYFKAPSHTDTAMGKGNTPVYVVQVRDGPVGSSLDGYVPRPGEKIEHIIKPTFTHEEDLLAWERFLKDTLKENGGQMGLVVETDLPLSSHLVVHAVVNAISVVRTKDKYKEGDSLRALEHQGISKKGMQRLSHHINTIFRHENMKSMEAETIIPAVASIHAMAGWDDSDHLLRLQARGLVYTFRALAATVIGEMRYWSVKTRKGAMGISPGLNLPVYENYGGSVPVSKSRNVIYHDLRNMDYVDIMFNLAVSRKAYNTTYWMGSYGGRKWGRVTRMTENYGKALLAFIKTPTPYRYSRLVMAANVALNETHNTGTALAKIIGNWMDTLAHAPALGFINYKVAEFVNNKH